MIILKLLIGEGNFSGAGDEQFFCRWAAFSPYLQGFPQRFARRCRTVHTWWGQQARLKDERHLIQDGGYTGYNLGR